MRIGIVYFLLVVAACTACASGETSTPLPEDFATAVLPTSVSAQPTSAIEIPSPVIIANTPTLPPPVEGITTTQLNVRAEPDKDSPALGMLNIFDKVQIFGKDSSGEWYRITYADSFGWVSAQYVQVDSEVEIPFLPTKVPTAEPIVVTPTEFFPKATQDGDSMQNPLAEVIFSPSNARSLQVNDAISAPTGDAEDWLKFTPYTRYVEVEVKCTGALNVELWKDNARAEALPLACGENKVITVMPNREYFLRLWIANSNEFHFVNYVAQIKSVQ